VVTFGREDEDLMLVVCHEVEVQTMPVVILEEEDRVGAAVVGVRGLTDRPSRRNREEKNRERNAPMEPRDRDPKRPRR
jgi:hypothetical protein